jgi:hypothetical protein
MIVVTGVAGFGSGVTHQSALACTEAGRKVEE